MRMRALMFSISKVEGPTSVPSQRKMVDSGQVEGNNTIGNPKKTD